MATSKWILDPSHSEVEFKVKHMMISNVSGKFTKFDASVETEGEDFMTAKVSFTAEVNSISTGADQRDEHLKGADFFEAGKYPQMIFTTTKYENVDNDGSYEVYGDLTIHGVTKTVKLDAEFGGVIKDPWGNTRAGITASGKINRKDFGLTWNILAEGGGLVLGDEVNLNFDIQLIRQS